VQYLPAVESPRIRGSLFPPRTNASRSGEIPQSSPVRSSPVQSGPLCWLACIYRRRALRGTQIFAFRFGRLPDARCGRWHHASCWPSAHLTPCQGQGGQGGRPRTLQSAYAPPMCIRSAVQADGGVHRQGTYVGSSVRKSGGTGEPGRWEIRMEAISSRVLEPVHRRGGNIAAAVHRSSIRSGRRCRPLCGRRLTDAAEWPGTWRHELSFCSEPPWDGWEGMAEGGREWPKVKEWQKVGRNGGGRVRAGEAVCGRWYLRCRGLRYHREAKPFIPTSSYSGFRWGMTWSIYSGRPKQSLFSGSRVEKWDLFLWCCFPV